MKTFNIFFLLLFSIFVTAQNSLHLAPNMDLSTVNNVPTAVPGVMLQLDLQDPDFLMRFQTGYRQHYTTDNVLNLQQFHFDAIAGHKAFDWMTFVGGFGLNYEKIDYDKIDGPGKVNGFVFESEYMMGLEFKIWNINLLLHNTINIDGSYRSGLKVSYLIRML